MKRLASALSCILLIVVGLVAVSAPAAQALPASFQKQTVFSGLTQPTNIEFAPNGQVFVAEKSGLIKVFDSLSDTTPTVYADLRTQVHNFWDRGLLGLALHPDYPADPRVYVLYAYDAVPGGSAPRWGTAGATADPCPSPPGATNDGCLVTGRLSVISPSGAETPLITDWCQQHPSHSTGDLQFGADGALYASAGDGASFNFADYGQDNLPSSDITPDNPCGDPPNAVGTALSPPSAEGGALRAQDVRTSGDPAGLDGTLIRIDPDTGAAAAGNPNAGNADQNVARIVANGLRNPFRITSRPGTSEIWSGEVGWGTWEEINRVVSPTSGVTNFGWPCYEGGNRQGGYDNLNLTLCENFYAAGAAAHTQPYFAWNHATKPAPNDPCPSGGSSSSGVAFYAGGPYPAAYDGALFFSDYSRSCIWVMTKGANGLPDQTTTATFDSGIPVVELETGPGGDLFAVDFSGKIIRYIYDNTPPVAVINASATSGSAPLAVSFSGTSSSDADGDPLTYAWDLDGDGELDDSTAATPSRTYTQPGSYVVRLRVSDGRGGQGDATVTINVNNTPPSATIDSPTTALTWAVGQNVTFSGTGTDAQDGTIPGSRMSWALIMHHCPSTCHEHQITTYTGSSGSFQAPDHEYPSHLELRLTVTDAHGLTDTDSVLLQPKTVNLTFASTPSGLQLGFNGEQTLTPFTRTVIVGSSNSISAPSPQTSGGQSVSFGSWSDGGAATHQITAPATATTYTAGYTPTTSVPGLVAGYAMDEGAGTSVGDASGLGNTGTTTATTWTATGKYGSALSFNGSSSWVTVPDAASLRLTNGMTVEAWVRPSTVTSWRTVVMKQHASGLAYVLLAGSDSNRPHTAIHTTSDADIGGTASLPLNTWSHLATTYDGTTLRLYVNGTQVAQRTAGGPIRTDNGVLRIGGNSLWGEYFAGQIDEVRVYDKALTATQIQTDMNTPVGTPQPPDTQAPTAPGAPAATGGPGSAQLSWTASTDNVGVSGYMVHRSTTPGFTPSGANQVGSTESTSFADSGLVAGTYYYRVRAFDAAGNVSASSAESSATATQPPATEGLVAAYGMNQGTGVTVADASGFGNTGTTTATTWTSGGKYGSALSFDGSSSWVTVPDAASLRLTNGMTVEAWVRPSTVTSWRTVVMKQHASGLAYVLLAGSDSNRPHTAIHTTSDADIGGTASLPLNTWSHLATTYDGTTLRLYVNGTQVAQRTAGGPIRTDNGVLRIGGNSLWGEYFAGQIDEVRVYDKALTATQIQTDMNTPIS
ncbi:PKD domain-containing protein [Nonomuraea sp. NN258]|uniref:LamG-like jellyroll fold domain-containing protein n=1 Tax=Nonomuraea antri TaxID=2730852 RepID=UPI0015699CB8|nr:LamG-like jellyroll fold domain-containing protein [Nonomuraea antri]NRQ31395.1 PKD domain-containing protein [Nonomuraea antri]